MGADQSKGITRAAVTTRSSVASGDIKKEDLAALQQRCMPQALKAKTIATAPAPAPAPTPVKQATGAVGPSYRPPAVAAGPTNNAQAAQRYAQPAMVTPVDPRVVPYVPMSPNFQRSNSHYQAFPLPRSSSMVRTPTQIPVRSSSMVRTPAQQEAALAQVNAPLVPSFVPQPVATSVQVPSLARSDSWVRLQGQGPMMQEMAPPALVQLPQQPALQPKPAVIRSSALPRSSSLYLAEQQAVSGYPASSVNFPMSQSVTAPRSSAQAPRQQAFQPVTRVPTMQPAPVLPQTASRTMPAASSPLSPRFQQGRARVIQNEAVPPQRPQLSPIASAMSRGRSPPPPPNLRSPPPAVNLTSSMKPENFPQRRMSQ